MLAGLWIWVKDVDSVFSCLSLEVLSLDDQTISVGLAKPNFV